MSEEIANQSEESPIEVEKDSETEALFDSFGLAAKTEKKDIEFPKMDEPTDPLTTEDDEDEPTEEIQTPEKRTIKVKYNGEDKEVDESEAPSLIQKGMNYDKVQQKLNEQQKALDEVARMQGFKDHAELIAELPKLREQQQQKEIDQFEQAKQKIIDDLVYNGVDEQAAREYAENNPLVKQAKEKIETDKLQEQVRQNEIAEQRRLSGWAQLYEAFPDAGESAKAFAEGGRPDWYTNEMESMIYQQGYKPLDAYRLANMDKIQTNTKKSTEQRMIKERQLGVRSAAAGQAPSLDSEVTVLPAQMALAEEFGVSVKGIQRQSQLIKNRR
jgi:hypothetical protein